MLHNTTANANLFSRLFDTLTIRTGSRSKCSTVRISGDLIAAHRWRMCGCARRQTR
jgi:hypothetical protein